MKRLLLTAVALAGAFASFNAQAACGKISISDMNWASATLIANVDAFVLDHGYGCEVELVTGDTMPTGASMVEKGQPDVAPEFWTNNFKEALAKGVEEKRLAVLGDALSDGGEEGFWVPAYLVEKDPSLATIEGVIANAKMFTYPEDPDRSAFMNCPAGWGCQVTSAHLFKALNLEAAGFVSVDPGSGAALAGSIAKAYERKEPWFGYYWAPTPVLGKYQMVKVDIGVTDVEHFETCLTQEICENPRPSNFPAAAVKTIVVADLQERAPDAVAYLSKRSYANALMNGLLAWMEDEQADGKVAAKHFLSSRSDIWEPWVTAEAAARIKGAL